MKYLIKDLIFVNESSTIDGIDDSVNKIGGAKSKNMIILNFLAKFKLLIESSFRLSFLIPKGRLAFIKLSQTFIKVGILQYFNPDYYIYIEIDALGYVICAYFSFK